MLRWVIRHGRCALSLVITHIIYALSSDITHNNCALLCYNKIFTLDVTPIFLSSSARAAAAPHFRRPFPPFLFSTRSSSFPPSHFSLPFLPFSSSLSLYGLAVALFDIPPSDKVCLLLFFSCSFPLILFLLFSSLVFSNFTV